jgi:hypothetical protein
MRRIRDRLAQASLGAAAFALLCCLAAFVAAFLPASGHPPLSDYIGVVAVPLAWMFALFGLGSAIAGRRALPRARYSLAVAWNVAALVAGAGIWLLWPYLRSV